MVNFGADLVVDNLKSCEDKCNEINVQLCKKKDEVNAQLVKKIYNDALAAKLDRLDISEKNILRKNVSFRMLIIRNGGKIVWLDLKIYS